MKKFTFLLLTAMMVLTLGTSCSKEKQLAKRLEGTWAIDKWDGTITPTGGGIATPFTFTNVGTMTFKEDGTGSYSITTAGTTQNGTINWTNTSTTVTITESGEPTKIYTVITNEKEKQVWTTSYNDANLGTISETMNMSLK